MAKDIYHDIQLLEEKPGEAVICLGFAPWYIPLFTQATHHYNFLMHVYSGAMLMGHL